MNLHFLFGLPRAGRGANHAPGGARASFRLPRPAAPVRGGMARLAGRVTLSLGLGLVPALSAMGDGGQLTGAIRQLALLRSAVIAQAPRADVSVTVTGPQSVGVNTPLRYRIVVTNFGPTLAPNVRVLDHLPPSLSYVSANTTKGRSSISLGIVRTEVGALLVGESAVIDLIVIPRQTGPVVNGVAVQHDMPDPNPSNNSDAHLVTVLPFPPTIPKEPETTEPPCAADVSASVAVARGPLFYAPLTRRFLQEIVLENQGDQPIQGPVTLLIEGLAPIVLTNASGFTGCWTPLNTPYLNVPVGADNRLDPGEVSTVTVVMAIPPNRGVVYRTRVLGGPGGR